MTINDALWPEASCRAARFAAAFAARPAARSALCAALAAWVGVAAAATEPARSGSAQDGPLRATLKSGRAASRPITVTLSPERETTVKLDRSEPVTELEFSRPVRTARMRVHATLAYPVDRRRVSAMAGVEKAAATAWAAMSCRQTSCKVAPAAAGGEFIGRDGSVNLRPVLAGVRNRLREPGLAPERKQRLEDGLRQCERAKREFCRAFLTHQEVEITTAGNATPYRLLLRMPLE